MTDPDHLEIVLDFASVQRGAERVRKMLLDLRQRFDLSPFEYSKQVRIAPTEVPHSHPMITLNTFVHSDLGLLSARFIASSTCCRFAQRHRCQARISSSPP
jgi:hypothetical protein